MTGDTVVAYPNTLTGSIGVVFMKPDLHGLYDKLGLHVDILSRGRFAGLYSVATPPTPVEQDKLRAQVDDFYHAFVSRVAAGRHKPYETIEPLAQGRVWLGTQAKSNGLVDEIGGLDRARAGETESAHRRERARDAGTLSAAPQHLRSSDEPRRRRTGHRRHHPQAPPRGLR